MAKKNEGKLKQLSELFFIRITRNKAKERINKEFKSYKEKEEIKIGEKFSKEETKSLRKDFFETRGREIIKEEARKARGKAMVLAFVGVLGIGGFGGYMLGSGTQNHNNSEISGVTVGEEGIEIDLSEVSESVYVKNVLQQDKEDKHSLFVKELQDAALNEDVEYIYELKQKATQEIEQLETSTEVLDYVKQMYVDRYNSIHEEQIGIENVNIYKYVTDIVFYEDKAQNGDEILRYCTEKEVKEMGIPIDGELSKITTEIKTEGGLQKENVTYHDGKFVTIYGKNEEVLDDKETISCELGDVLLHGINRSISINNPNESFENIEIYKERFIEAVANYRKSRYEPSVKEKNEIQTDELVQDGIEPGDD